MPEGVRTASGSVTEARPSTGKRVQPPEPDPSPDAPRGWRFDRDAWEWVPKLAPGRKKGKDYSGGDHVMGVPDDRTGLDPDPSWMAGDQGGKGDDGKIKFEDVPQQVKDDIAGFAGLVGTPILAILQQADPYCGTALAQSFEGIVDATLPLICRSSKIIKYFSEDKSDWLLWGKLALAFRPFAQAVLQHHILRTVEVYRDENGIPHVVPAGSRQSDPLQPPVQPDDYNYAA